MADPDLHHILLYTYVPDMLDRRGPYRDAHLAKVLSERSTGHVWEAGAFDPPTGAVIVFRGVGRDHVERFVASDPYVINGLVADHRIEKWNIVRGK